MTTTTTMTVGTAHPNTAATGAGAGGGVGPRRQRTVGMTARIAVVTIEKMREERMETHTSMVSFMSYMFFLDVSWIIRAYYMKERRRKIEIM